MKIALIVGYITTGGFQTFLINLLNVLLSHNISLDIYYIYLPNDIITKYSNHNYIKMDDYTLLDKLCAIFHFNVIKYIIRNFNKFWKSNEFACIYLNELAKRSKKIHTNYDKVISLSEHLTLYLNSCFENTNERICWIHPNYKLAKMHKQTDYEHLKKMGHIYAVSESGAETLKEEFTDLSDRIDFIENILNEEEILKKSDESIENPFNGNGLKLLTICRMSNGAKRIDRMLQIAKRLEKLDFNFQWIFIGDGPDLNEFKKLTLEFNLEKVKFIGAKSNPYPYYKLADLFILLSDYEGNPYVLKEARLFALPYLITDFDLKLIKEELNCFGIPNNNLLVENTVDFLISFKKCKNGNRLNQNRDINKLLEVFEK